MPEPMTPCLKCGAAILQATASLTGGLCTPCKKGWPPCTDSAQPFEVSCTVRPHPGPPATFHAALQDLLEALDQIDQVENSFHPGATEVVAQRALLRRSVPHRVRNLVFDVNAWGTTGFALRNLFDQNKASMVAEGKRFTIADLTKEEWFDGIDLAGEGGFLYRDASGTVVYKQATFCS